MRLALGLFLGLRPLGGGGGPIASMVADFAARVDTDGGVTEAQACLTTILTDLNDIS